MWICPNCGREFKRTNQDHYCGKAPASIDEYILRQDVAIQPALISLRNAIHDAIPEAVESKNHIGVHVGEEAVAHFNERLKGIEIYKGNLRLKLNQEIPLALISDIAKWCFTMEQMS